MVPTKEDIKDFRPISLLGGAYKILGKLLDTGLEGVVGKLVSNSQTAFVKGRQILRAVLPD